MSILIRPFVIEVGCSRGNAPRRVASGIRGQVEPSPKRRVCRGTCLIRAMCAEKADGGFAIRAYPPGESIAQWLWVWDIKPGTFD